MAARHERGGGLIVNNDTWEMVDLPSGHKPIGLKWVYKLEKDTGGRVVKHKARLVSKGYVQRQGVDFEEVFAPVARLETVGLIIGIAAQQGWKLHHMGVESAFLNGELAEEVYVSQPPGFEIEGQDSKVLRPKKALYGLRQAPRAWNFQARLNPCCSRFERKLLEHSVDKKTSAGRLLVCVYVDDLLITSSTLEETEAFKAEMKHQSRMSDLGLLSH